MDNNLVQIALQNVNMAAILPSVILSCFGMGLLLINVFLPRGTTRHAVWISLIGLVVTGFFVMTGWGDPQYGFNDAVAMDNYAAFFSITFLFAAGLTILMSDDYLTREGYPVSEYYPMVLFATAGAMWMASGTDMMTIFLGLEVMSICLYVLAGFFRSQVRSNEAGLKYFLLGAFASAFLLYGSAMLFGYAGSLELGAIVAGIIMGLIQQFAAGYLDGNWGLFGTADVLPYIILLIILLIKPHGLFGIHEIERV